MMTEWVFTVQRMIDWIDDNATENPTLMDIASNVGYSPYYCSMQFHLIAGMSIKSYIARRRLALAAFEVRDTNARIIDIAIECGFSSQSAVTRAFLEAYGCTPAAYRKNPIPIPLLCKKIVVTPSHYTEKGDLSMGNLVLPSYRFEYIPAHKYLGVYKSSTTKNGEMWPAHDCDLLTGIVSSFANSHRIITPHTAGWSWEGKDKNYFYGLGVDSDYDGVLPEGFELRGAFPDSYYLVFCHPPFDYLADNIEVMKRVEELAWNFDPKSIGYEWNEEVCQDYQRHYPEGLGYQILRPVRKIG